nr:RNA-directed DNA polymerase, eukaryota, reverse transcriptase zinc-binding domain protein [Tanacetum cinerariifolium]
MHAGSRVRVTRGFYEKCWYMVEYVIKNSDVRILLYSGQCDLRVVVVGIQSWKNLSRHDYNNNKKITWVSWSKGLAAKEYGGLGVSSYYALNRALLFKWVWRFISQDNYLWFRVIFCIHSAQLSNVSSFHSSLWKNIIREVQSLKSQGVDLLSHCRIRVGNGFLSRFWKDKWIGDNHLCHIFPRVYALETNKDCSVAEKLNGSVLDSFRRNARGGVEEHQFAQLRLLIDPIILSFSEDRWVWELNSYGVFHVKDIRRFLD